MSTFVVVIIAVIAGIGALLAYMLLYEQFNLKVTELELSFPNLPPEYDGYTILHLTDLHLTKIGLLEKMTMRIISSREVDACFITGDVTAEPRASDIFRRVCSVIKHRDPIVMVLGNSEHKPWLDSQALVDALTFDGLKMLINESVVFTRNSGKVTIVGVDDAYYGLSDLDAAFDGVRPDDFVIFLTHTPSIAPDAIERGADLILAGHTHGGQVRIPGYGVLWTHMRANQSLNDGLYTSEDISRLTKIDAGHSKLFVNRGVGTSRIHIRFLCPPEIAYITLRKAGDEVSGVESSY
ncbi:MAG: metallophosphoesterase [Armatimonadota bacterium]|jgi:predicted MPP superfamily phosphohydrolase